MDSVLSISYIVFVMRLSLNAGPALNTVMLSIFHNYGFLHVCLVFFTVQGNQSQTMLQAPFLFSAIRDKSEM